MSKQLRIWLFVLLSTLLTSTTLLAEGVITMTTSKAVGETIKLKIEANGDVSITGVRESARTDGYSKDYTLTNQTVIIRGDVTELSCEDNQLTSLDVSKNTSLTELDCGDNQLISLDVSKNTALTELNCSSNPLTSLDVSGCTSLTKLWCYYNPLTSLNVSGCTSLTELDCRISQLSSLNVSGCTSLTKLDCSGPYSSHQDDFFGVLTSLDMSGCSSLTDLTCSRNKLTSLDVSSCPSLKKLDCSANQLTDLKVSGSTALTALYCSSNQLSSLDVSKNTALTALYCSSNQLSSLDVSKNTALTELGCGGNQLTSLDVSGCTALTKLGCGGNQLTSLDVSGCTALTTLACSQNQLTSLDVSGCIALRWLNCSENQIKEEAMTQLVASLPIPIYNKSNNREYGDFIVASNSALEGNVCSKADVASAREKNWTPLKRIDEDLVPYEGEGDNLQVGNGVISMTTTKAVGETIALAIKANGGIAIEGAKTPLQPDGQNADYTLTSQTIIIRGDVTELSCPYNQLTSLDVSGGSALTSLNCRNNQLTSLDISKTTSLTTLDCRDNKLTSLDVSGSTSLTTLDCRENKLTSLDVSGCTALTKLDCSDPNFHNSERPGPLTSLKVNGCTSLTELDCSFNQLTSLNVSGCTSLTELNCWGNQLTSLDVSKNTALTTLDCFYNQLTSLDVSGCTALTTLFCVSNQLTSLDVSKNNALTSLDCRYNQLTSLDLSKNSSLTELRCGGNHLTSLNVSGCPSLNYLDCSANQIKGKAMTQLVASLPTCTSDYHDRSYRYNYSGGYFIVVSNYAQEGNFCSKADVASAREKNWTSLKSIDGELILYKGESDNPQLPVGSGIIKMTTTRAIGEIIKLGFKANGRVVIEGAKTPLQPDGQIAYYTLTSQTIIIRGDVTELNCAASQLASLDVSGCPSLIKLSCGSPYGEKGTLTSLKASGCTALTELDCRNIQLSSLDVSGCTALTKLNFQNIQLASLDVSGCTSLTELNCSNNQLTSLNLSGCTSLTGLNCSVNRLTSLDLSGCTALRWLYCSSNQLTNLNVSDCTALIVLECSSNQLTSLNVSDCTALTKLDCGYNQLTSLDVSKNTALTKLDCWYNQLTSLDVSGCTSLTKLDCWDNQLTSLDVSGFGSLRELDCGYNKLTSLDVSKNSSLIELNCYGNALTSLVLSNCFNLRYVDCSNNRIKGEAMSRLVAGLPTCIGDYHGQYSDRNSYSGGYFVAVSSSDNEWNNCSKENVATARAKNWTPLKEVNRGFKYNGLKLAPYEGVDLNQPVGHGVITMTTARAVGEPITLLFRANGPVTLKGVKEILQSDGSTTYQILPGQTITLRGNVTALRCEDSELTSLDVSGCPSLTRLDCWGNQLKNLDVSQNRALQRLVCHKNQLTSLDVSQNSVLALLSCGDNQLTNLDISQNAALKSLYSDGNQLTSLDVSQNSALEGFYCRNNQLTSLDLSQNSALKWLYCNDNRLTSLDLSHNSDLMELECSNNQIKGAEMTKLVNSLPKTDWRQKSKFYVVVKDSIEGNVCLKSDVAIVANKGWTPLGYNRSTEAWEYYGGRETDSFGVSLTHEGEGSVIATGADDLKAVPYGTKLMITATPAEGYELAALTANGFDILESKSFEVTGYTKIKATFRKKTFAISLAKSAHGEIEIAESVDLQAVPYGTTLTISATPETGYELTALTANGEDILATKSFVVKSDTEVKATFTKQHFAVTLTQEAEGLLVAKGYDNLSAVPYGTELTISAQPKMGYELTALTANKEDILATRKVVITENTTIKATFAKKTFAVTLDKEGEGVLDATGADDLKAVPYGTKLTIIATPAEGYELKALLAGGFDIRSTKSVEVTGDTRIKAIFKQQTFAVTLPSCEHGKIEIAEPVDLKAVPYGTTLTITATPETGYELNALSANGDDILATKSFVVKGATEIRATFSMAHFAVTLTHDGEGKVDATGAEDLTAVPYGTELTIKAMPKQGYELTALTANGKDILATRKVVVTENLTIKATFAKKTFVVTLDKEGEGVLNATGADNLKAVPYGTKLTIIATPAEGYELTGLLAGGFDILSTKSVEVTGDTKIKAIFTQKTFAVKLTSNEHGKITIVEPVDLDAVPYGTTLTVKATGKNAQCELTALTANGVDILATKSFVVKGVTKVKATFVDHTGVETTVTQQVQLYPNPATDYVIVEGVAPASEVTLHSMTGERLYAGRADSRGVLQIDLTPYADGVYLVCVAGETYRVVVRR